MRRHRSLWPLSHQHHNGLALCVLAKRALAADSSPAQIAAQARRAVERYDVELTNHFALEEQILFPAVRPFLPEASLIEDLLAEHRRLEELIASLRCRPQQAALTSFLSLLGAHIRKEENVLFEAIQAHTPPEVLEQAGQQLDARAVRVCL